MAKKVGVRVLRFSIGYPPKILGFRRGETEYSIGATPFGGYVRMLGDEVGEKPTPDEIKFYLHEIGLDLIGAAREHGAVLDGSRDFDDNLRALCRALRVASGAGVAHDRCIGRELSPTRRCCSTKSAASPKSTTRSKSWRNIRQTLLVEAYCKRAFPTQSLGKRVADRAGRTAVQHHFRAAAAHVGFHVRRAAVAAGRRQDHQGSPGGEGWTSSRRSDSSRSTASRWRPGPISRRP